MISELEDDVVVIVLIVCLVWCKWMDDSGDIDIDEKLLLFLGR